MGRYKIKSGYIVPQNMQAGTASITTDANGDGTTSVTFTKAFKNTPKVFLEVQGNDITGQTAVLSKSALSFVPQLDGSALTGQPVSVDWFACDMVI